MDADRSGKRVRSRLASPDTRLQGDAEGCSLSKHAVRLRSRIAVPSPTPLHASRTAQDLAGRLWMGLGLALLMALTRLSHFGHDVQPLDASWAVFVMAGALLPGRGGLVALCAETLSIDLVAYWFGIDRACLSPAYATLLPAYVFLWQGGRFAVRTGSLSYLRLGVATTLTSTAAFAMTNAGYFLLSPAVATMRLSAFVVGVSPYYPQYVLTTLGYVVAGCWLATRTLRSEAATNVADADAG